jgi:hypothetical protein
MPGLELPGDDVPLFLQAEMVESIEEADGMGGVQFQLQGIGWFGFVTAVGWKLMGLLRIKITEGDGNGLPFGAPCKGCHRSAAAGAYILPLLKKFGW